MRDQIVGDLEHFKNRIALCDEWLELAEKSAAKGGNGWGELVGDASKQLQRVSALYSMGATIDKVRSEYAELPDLASRDLNIDPRTKFNPAEMGSGFSDFLWVSALAALFDDADGAALLAEAVETFGMTDFLVDSFIGSLIEFREPSQTLQLEIISNFHGVKPVNRSHEPLKAAAELSAKDPGAASEALTKYVTKDWYRLHSWTTWHNGHKASRGSENYSGYWSFEGAAVAKVFGIDDSELETCKYYPWDLVHP